MGDKSKIEWTDASWTPIRARNKATGKVGWHCEHVTAGCEHCYSETMNMRHGTQLSFKPGHRKDVEIFLDEEMLRKPLEWKRPRMVFVCSMTDLFAEFVSDEWIDKMFYTMARSRWHTFQILTKRSARMRDYLNGVDPEKWVAFWSERLAYKQGIPKLGVEPSEPTWPPANIWFGVSAEDQERANERIPDLLAIPAAVRFVSYEPALGPIDFTEIAPVNGYAQNVLEGYRHDFGIADTDLPAKVDWVIYGGESGANRRPSKIEWADSTMKQCEAAGTKFFFKQDGAFRSGQRGRASASLWLSKEFPVAHPPGEMAAGIIHEPGTDGELL